MVGKSSMTCLSALADVPDAGARATAFMIYLQFNLRKCVDKQV